MVHPDPEAAARGDIPEAYARTLGVESVWGEAPPGATEIAISFPGTTVRVVEDHSLWPPPSRSPAPPRS
jgi:hypothetical protein